MSPNHDVLEKTYASFHACFCSYNNSAISNSPVCATANVVHGQGNNEARITDLNSDRWFEAAEISVWLGYSIRVINKFSSDGTPAILTI